MKFNSELFNKKFKEKYGNNYGSLKNFEIDSNLNYTTIWKLTTGKINGCNIKTAFKICKVLEIDINKLFIIEDLDF